MDPRAPEHRIMSEPPDGAGSLQLLVFELADTAYALESRCIREVVHAVMIAPLPDAPEVIEGVIDFRGEIVPVYDLRLRFGLPARRLHPDERMIVAWTGDRLVAVRCDRADRLAPIAVAAVVDPEPIARGGRQISGVAQLPDGLALIHDLRAFLDASERESLDAALVAGSRTA
jgi:purine-binding chemotaxis protein CheW